MDKLNFNKVGKIFPLIGIAILFYLIYDIGINKIFNAFVSIPWYFFLFSFVIFIPRTFLYAYKWQYICKKQKIDVSLIYLAKLYLISLFYGSVTPGALGLHLRIYYLKEKSNASIEKCITNSLIESTLAFLSGLFLSLVGTIILIEYFPGLSLTLFIAFIIFLSIFIIFMQKKVGQRVFNLFVRPFIPGKYKEDLANSFDSLYKDLPSLRQMIFPFVIETFILIVAATQVYILSFAFSIDLPYHLFILLSITSVIIGNAVPVTVGGLGVREGAFVYLLLNFNVMRDVAIVLSLCGYIVKILIPGLIGWALTFSETRKKR